MTALTALLDHFNAVAQTEREKGTYFEELCIQYFKHEASYKDLYSDVWTYAEWATLQGLDARDTGIDLVAKTNGTDDYHAIQCKFYDQHHKITKADIDSFFTASGKKPFTHRIIVTTCLEWSEHAEDALQGQQPPVSKIDLNNLENSQIDWSRYQPKQAVVLKAKKMLREHQQSALAAVTHGLQTAERGKLIMACGTGKTFTSLKIAEKLAGKGKRVLFLVPSLSLLSQTLTEWTQESETPLHSFAVCSDSDVGKKRKKDDDIVQTFTHELRYPATTNPRQLASEMQKRHDAHHMSVVFSTYHSIDVISHAQHLHGLADFDLIVCDEAHRTTGSTFAEEEDSNFVKVHEVDFIKSAKRLYMTATPRIYADIAKASAERDNVTLFSMDDEEKYGKELFVINFSEAVSRGLLVDYKVIVLAVDAKYVSARIQGLLADDSNQLKVDDASKIIGCWKALSKIDTQQDLTDDNAPMRRAVAFCQVIEKQQSNNKTHKVSSKQIKDMFGAVVNAYIESEQAENPALRDDALQCEAEHIDGGMNASEKESKLNWLKAEPPANTCRILSNVRCLSEGVDVPALDAVLFLTPRNSQVDVVQSVGRVMRLAAGKKRGYVILPVVIPEGMEPDAALNDNKIYAVVWQVLQALRSHDDRFDAMVNKLDLIGKDTSKMEVIAISDKFAGRKGDEKTKRDGSLNKNKGTNGAAGKNGFSIGNTETEASAQPTQADLQFEIGEIERAIYAKVVKKCGNRSHWEDWANDISDIAKDHITRIKAILENPANTAEVTEFERFISELRDDLNDSISHDEAIEMLAQHLITKPVFDALFEGYSFASNNPMSLAMQGVLNVLEKHHIEKEADTLQRFYDSVKVRAAGIDNAAGKQKIVVELYDKFFRNAFPRMTERLGIVYTPVEVVDFIIHSVNDVLKQEFGQTLGSQNVHIIDPFTGTGTFITRLLQSGLIAPEQLAHKYKHEIHANEIVLLAYYIAAINIESVYHDLVQSQQPNTATAYEPFNGICLTDTFQLYEKDDLVSALLVDNSARRTKQKQLDIRVIIGNPPYSSGQESANDNNANIAYPLLDESIRSTYAKHSKASLQNKLYDSYIRAIRWASDRIKDAGVIGFVTNAGWVDANTADGLRKCLATEFSNIYVFHLRGNQRTSGEQSRKEGGKIFGSGSRAPIAISILVKNPNAQQHGQIYFYDIGDYLSQQEKLAKINDVASINGITNINGWQTITPDVHGDWVNQRDNSFSEHISLGDKKDKNSVVVFDNFSLGVATNRDAWVYNSSKLKLEQNMRQTIGFFNQENVRYHKACEDLQKSQHPELNSFLSNDHGKISWTVNLKKDAGVLNFIAYQDSIRHSLYRPFSKQNLYFNKTWNERRGQMPRIFPNASAENRVICLTVTGTKGFSVLMSDALPDLHLIGDAQCFPLKLYEKVEVKDAVAHDDLFATPPLSQAKVGEGEEYTIKDGITDAGLAHFANFYAEQRVAQGECQSISKEDLFYYIYGILHSEDYKARYVDNLTKELPRIPRVKQYTDFIAFMEAGRALAALHVDYETVEKYPVSFVGGNMAINLLEDKDFYVTNMKFAKGTGLEKWDKTTIIYNHHIALQGIPLEAYGYVVNGKPAIEWVMERQGVSTHKDSGIVNDANDWAIETMGNARYPLELLQRVITVSLETVKIVNGLPKLDI